MTTFRLTSIADLSFGVHTGRSFDALDHDFLCIAGVNESGKSTLAEFLQWMIAGPGGNTASAARFQRQRFNDPIGGHLVGRLDEDPIEITARFVLKGNGLPNDTREVRRCDRPIDTPSWTSLLGQITPADYRLLHRLRGADLGGPDESRSFSDVFTRFAIGADSAQVNPRERLAGLLRRSTQLEKDLRLRRTELKRISAALATASARPAEVERLHLAAQEKQRSVEALAQELGDLHREENLLDRALEIAPARREFDRIGAELGRLGPISEQWRQVARSHDEILRRQADIAERVTGLERLDARAMAAAGVAGVSASDLRGHGLSFTERTALSTGARRVAELERELRDARTDAATLSGRLEEQETAILRSAAALGIEPPDGLSLLGQEVTLRDLITEAGQWSARERDAAEAEARVAGLRARVDAGSSDAPTTRRISPRLLAAMVGVVLAAASSLISPLLTVAVAVLTVLAILVLPDRVAGSSGAPPADAESHELPEASRRAAELRSRADDTRSALAAALGRLGITDLPPSSAASAHLTRLTDLAREVTVLVSEREARARMIGTIDDLETRLSLARADLAADLAARGIHRVPPSDQFDQWLQSYEEALLAVREQSEAAGTLRRLEAERDDLLEPVIDDLRDLSWPSRVDRIGQMARLVDEVVGLETSARQWAARLELAADETVAASVDELLRSLDEQELRERLAAVREQIITTGERRDIENREAEAAAISARALIENETNAELEVEHGDVVAAIEQLDHDKEVLRIAAEVLGSVIDQFEAEDQDPLIKRAQALVERVVPDWGDLIFSRSEKGEAIIERRDGPARLDDSRLSDGARALLYLALRLAFVAADTERRTVALPILCDDPLVHLDDTRRPGAIGLLADASRTNQVLLFTCDDATVALARDNGAHVVHL